MDKIAINIKQLTEWYLQNDITRMIIIFLGFIMLLAFISYVISKKMNVPSVVGYIIIGALFSTSVVGHLKFLPANFTDYYNLIIRNFNFIAYITLNFVAFLIGLDLSVRIVRTLGKNIIIMSVCEALGAFAFVLFGLMWIGHLPFYQALVLGALASATAPPATVMIIKALKSRGPLTSTILAIVGFDDAISLIIYSFASPIARTYASGSGHFSLYAALAVPLFKIAVSMLIGGIGGYFAIKLLKKFREKQEKVIIIFALIFIISAIASYFDLSQLLTNMAAGFVVRNTAKHYLGLSDVFDIIMVPLYALFFIISGLKLKITLITNAGFILISIIYLIARMLGKILGAASGATISKAPPVVKKYAGFGLLSQVGVALALAYIIEQEFKAVPGFGALVFNLLLFTTFFTETIGPILLKVVLIKSGESNIPSQNALGRKK